MKSWFSTSSIAERVMRAINPICTAASVNAGIAMLCHQPEKLCVIGTKPPAGNHPSQMAKTKISIRPSQNSGIDRPNKAITMIDWSAQLRCRIAASSPAITPITTANTKARPVSDKVTGNRSMIAAATLRLSRIDCPRSPCRMRPYHAIICK